MDWIEERIETPPQADTETIAILPPPQVDIEILHGLAMAGDMREIRREADRLAALSPEYRPFAETLQRLARAYQSQAILNLIDQHLERKQVA